MNYNEIEKKWQKKWEETGIYRFNPKNVDKKLYVLEMLPYPSAARLHIGHWYNYGPSDTYARFKRMQGFEVFHPMGFDAFGLPAENYAIKTKIHPEDSTLSNIATMEEQLKAIGPTYDWDYEVISCLPDFYKWTQWCFLQLYKNGLAYRKEAPVNWCPSCNTVLANEQVLSEGECERCGTEVVRKNLTQWFFKITAYAEELLSGLDKLDWPEKTKLMQKNWIGKSTGGEIKFKVKDLNEEFTVFTTRADTLYGCTYVVLAPEAPIVDLITNPECKKAVEEYRDMAARQNEIERLSTTREKTGVFTGSYAINPINGRVVPIWIADYVLATYGTGCVMAVPAHDERDYDFATKYNLPIERVISGTGGADDTLPFVQYGIMTGSGEFDGITTEEGKTAIIEKLMEKENGAFKTNYRLRDWLISRQRYWGAPIPVVYCETCGAVAVPDDELPVLLPYDVDFTPEGTSPLLKHEGFMNTTCPKCGGPAKRDADTMDTFVCSSWYFLRYADNKNEKEAWSRDWINKLLPVDKYIGGAEHACMHLFYARFFVKALRDLGHLDFDEPFLSLVHQGTILGPDGNKMSKSRGNVVSPDSFIDKYGADVFRTYLMFGFNYTEGGVWNDGGIKAIHRFVDRVERLVPLCANRHNADATQTGAASKNEVLYAKNRTIKAVTEDLEKFQFNTAVARIMEYVNALYKYIDAGADKEFLSGCVKDLLIIMAPFIPHVAEELWSTLGYNYSIHNEEWPKFDVNALKKETVEIAVQINGKVRARLEIAADLPDDEVRSLTLADEGVKKHLEGKTIRKFIVVKNRLANIVVS